MKNSIFILSIMAMFALSCSNESTDSFEDQNLSLDRENHIVTLMNNLSSSQEFINRLTNTQARSNENDNGLMVIQDSWGLSWGVGDGNGSLYILGSGDGDGSIVELPTGEARFSAHSTNPSAAVLDMNTFATIYSSDCIENPRGVVNANVTGTYEALVLPFGTIYFIDQASTANIFTGHCEVSDAQPVFDENFELIDCTEATEYKTVRVRTLLRNNNGQELDPIFTASLR